MKKIMHSPKTKALGIGSVAGIALLVTFVILFFHKQPTIESEAQIKASKGKLFANQSLRFIANQGQVGTDAKYHVQGAGHTVLFYQNKIELRRSETVSGRNESTSEQNEIVLQFEGANPAPEVQGENKLPGVAHFYKDPNPENWQTDVPTYGSVMYKELYPGIDMAYIGDDGILESEFYVAPGADYHQIRVNYKGVNSLKLDSEGELIIETALGELVEKTPFAYQDIEGTRNEIEAQYVMLEDASIGFHLEKHDPDYPVVIDPELIFLTVIQGQFGGGEWANGVSLDQEGNLIMVGAANRFFPVTDTIEGSNHLPGLNNDGLLIKLDGTTGEVLYSALFGGSRQDYFNDIVLDDAGNMFLTGLTASTDFPALNAAQDTTGGSDDAFLVILNAEVELTYSTYLGGSGRDWSEGIDIDETGNIYIAGRTESLDFPTVGGYQQQHNGGGGTSWDLFIAKFNAAGSVNYATYLGGSGNELFGGIAVDTSGQVTIAGGIDSDDFPVANAYQDTYLGGSQYYEYDMIVARLNSDGNDLIYSTYFGGTDGESISDIEVGPAGDVFISGSTQSADFPMVNGQAFPETGVSDGVLLRLDNTGQPVFSLRTNLPGDDSFDGIAIEDTFHYAVGAWMDTIRIFRKTTDDSLSTHFEFAAPGHNINAVHLRNGYLGFAGSYWSDVKKAAKTRNNHDPESVNEVLSGSQCFICLLHIEEQFDIRLESVGIDESSFVFGDHYYSLETLIIRFNGPNLDGLKVGCDVHGNITINGVAIDILAEDVQRIKVSGSNGRDIIDLSEVSSENFPNVFQRVVFNPLETDRWNESDLPQYELVFEGIEINASDGDDMIFGSEYYINLIRCGKGDDLVVGGNGRNWIFGQEGNNTIFGGDNRDYIDAGTGNNSIMGGDSNDGIRGGAGNNTLLGGKGDDQIIYLRNDVKVSGGSGNDVLLDFSATYIQSKSNRLSNYRIDENSAIKKTTNIVLISDIAGIDTLSFAFNNSRITLDIALLNSEQTIDTSGVQVILDGIFEVVIGSDFDDEITVSPLPDTARHIDGRDGADRLVFVSEVEGAVDDGSTITTPGYADITYVNMETVEMPVASGISESVIDEEAFFSLGKNFPNPFTHETTIRYHLPEEGHVKVSIHDLSGKLVTVLVDRRELAGMYEVQWNGQNNSGLHMDAGVYIYQLETNGIVNSGKMVLEK